VAGRASGAVGPAPGAGAPRLGVQQASATAPVSRLWQTPGVSRRATRAPEPKGRITRADIAAKLRELSGEVEEVKEGRRFSPYLLGAAAVIVVIYRLGLWRGARHSTLLEIRRIRPG
jgi:hypothetical protein